MYKIIIEVQIEKAEKDISSVLEALSNFVGAVSGGKDYQVKVDSVDEKDS